MTNLKDVIHGQPIQPYNPAYRAEILATPSERKAGWVILGGILLLALVSFWFGGGA